MITKTSHVLDSLAYDLSFFGDLPELLFFDIETTGFSPASSQLYMIGCLYYKEDEFRIIQWLSEGPEDENTLLRTFGSFLCPFKLLIHFNGSRFDIPYLLGKSSSHDTAVALHDMRSLDLYKSVLPYKKMLGVQSLKQKDLERFLHIERNDMFSGRELISVYKSYLTNHEESLLDSLFLHNYEDLTGMLRLLPVLSIPDLVKGRFQVVRADLTKGIPPDIHSFLLLTLHPAQKLPGSCLHESKGCLLSWDENSCTIKIPVYDRKLKYFYPDYTNYYYLPQEDRAIHKSIAAYTDKKYRQKAKPSNCYVTRQSLFLPQFTIFWTPCFKNEYHGSDLFFEYQQDLLQNKDFLKNYTLHILSSLS